jgi:hypothetical protein
MVDVNPKFIRLFSFKVIIMRFVCKFTKALNIVETLFQLENKKYLKFKYIYIYIYIYIYNLKITRKITKTVKIRCLNEIFYIERSESPRSDTLVAIGKTVSENSNKNFSMIQQSYKIL